MISFIVILVVALILLIVAEIKKARFRWRFILIYVVSCSFMGPTISNETYKANTWRLYEVLRLVRDKISQNDIQSIRDAFRNFEPSCSKPLSEQARALYDSLKSPTRIIQESPDTSYDETRCPVNMSVTDKERALGESLILKIEEEKIL